MKIYTCIYIYIHIYLHIYLYMYIYIYTFIKHIFIIQIYAYIFIYTYIYQKSREDTHYPRSKKRSKHRFFVQNTKIKEEAKKKKSTPGLCNIGIRTPAAFARRCTPVPFASTTYIGRETETETETERDREWQKWSQRQRQMQRQRQR